MHFIHGDNALKKMQFKFCIFAFLITSREALTSTNIVITILKNSRFFYSINQTRFVFILHCFSNIVGITISDILRLCEKTTWKDLLQNKDLLYGWKKRFINKMTLLDSISIPNSICIQRFFFNYLFIPPFYFLFVRIDAITSKYDRYFWKYFIKLFL